jgi:hypothetical protein
MMAVVHLSNVRYTPLGWDNASSSFQANCTPFQPTTAGVPYSCLFTLSVCRKADVVGTRRCQQFTASLRRAEPRIIS